MFRYALQRLAWAIPTWLLISIIVFSLSRCASGDAVMERLRNNAESVSGGGIDDALYLETAQKLGLDKPLFYFTVAPKAFPDSLRFIVRQTERQAIERLLWQSGNWRQTIDYHRFIKDFSKKTSLFYNDSLAEKRQSLDNTLAQLLILDAPASIELALANLRETAALTPFENDAHQLTSLYQDIFAQNNTASLYVPTLRWHGFDNQYHHWLTRFLTGDFGWSKDDITVRDLLKDPLSITLVLGLFALIFAYLIGIPLGIAAATAQNLRLRRWLERGIFAAYAVPTFWIATLAAVFLTSRYYGFKIFPNIGLADVPIGTSTLNTLALSAAHLILPIFCMAIHPATVIARHLQDSLEDVMATDYIKTAKAKGVAHYKIVWQHAFRNAATPLITLLGRLLPSLVSGALAIETIFNLKGMGFTTIAALQGDDWQVVYAVLMLVSAMVLLSNLFADLLYRWANPRLRD